MEPQPHAIADAQEDTKRVRPNSELIRAAGGDLATTRKMSPDSNLLRVVRGEPGLTSRIRPDSSLIRAASGDPQAAPAPSQTERSGGGTAPPIEPYSSADSAASPMSAPEHHAPRLGSGPDRASSSGPAAWPAPADPETSPLDTAFFMEHALLQGRRRLSMLMVADACLLVVGIYLIVSWAMLPAQPGDAEMAPTSSPGTRGYVDWQDDGQPARIATGPVKATFHRSSRDPSSSTSKSSPRRVSSSLAGSAAMNSSSAGAATSGSTPPREAMGTEAMGTSPSKPPSTSGGSTGRTEVATTGEAALAQARRAARIVAARKAFLAQVPRRIHAQRKAIHDCYRQTLKLFENVRGFVDIEFVVNADGRVTSARASRNTTRSRTLGSCISGVFLSTTFPKPPDGAVKLRYPFHFAPRKK